MGVDVVGAILSVVLDHEDKRVLGEGAARHGLDDEAHGIVVVGKLGLDRVHPVYRPLEGTGVVMADAHQHQRRCLAGGDEGLEFAVPFLEPPVVGKRLVETAEIRIGVGHQSRLGGPEHLAAALPWLAVQRNSRGSCARRFARQIAIEAPVADPQARAQGGVPDIAPPLLAPRPIEAGDIARAWQDIGIGRADRIGRHALRARGVTDVDVAVGALLVVLQAPAGVVHRRFALGEVVGPRRGGPVPAGVAALAGIEEGVEVDELAGERMMVWRHRRSEDRQFGIAVAHGEIPEDLIVGAVLLDDVDHVPDVGSQEGHGRLVGP